MATYNLIYDFKHTLIGQSRSFKKKDQTITVRLSSQAIGSGGRANDFVAQLQLDLDRAWVTVKTASFPRNGLKEVKFKDLPAGNYRLRFEKSTDGVQIIGVGVISN